MSDDAASSLESAVRAALPVGAVDWAVSAGRRGGAWDVSMSHEASNGLVFETGRADANEALAVVLRAVHGSVEIERVARAPRLEHPETIAGVRALVQSFGWCRTEVRAVVGLLEEVGALGAAEADWFRTSFGEVRPPPRPSGLV